MKSKYVVKFHKNGLDTPCLPTFVVAHDCMRMCMFCRVGPVGLGARRQTETSDIHKASPSSTKRRKRSGEVTEAAPLTKACTPSSLTLTKYV